MSKCFCGTYKIHLPSDYIVTSDKPREKRCRYCGKKIKLNNGIWEVDNGRKQVSNKIDKIS